MDRQGSHPIGVLVDGLLVLSAVRQNNPVIRPSPSVSTSLSTPTAIPSSRRSAGGSPLAATGSLSRPSAVGSLGFRNVRKSLKSPVSGNWNQRRLHTLAATPLSDSADGRRRVDRRPHRGSNRG